MGKLLKNFAKQSNGHIQNMEQKHTSNFLGLIEKKLGLKNKSLSTCFRRRSGATSLADYGISLTNLKCTGHWASAKSAEEYLEHSKH
eukprot:7364332-Ditylum_brightwellii.AAC.1